jgi:hypothetical protein
LGKRRRTRKKTKKKGHWVAQDTPEQRRVNAEYKTYIHDAQKQ